MNRRLYSTDGSHKSDCSLCGFTPCRCAIDEDVPAEAQAPRVKREKSGRGGKVVTVIYDLSLSSESLKELARELRHTCSTGGTVKNGRIELRGDQQDRVVELLAQKGFKALPAGG